MAKFPKTRRGRARMRGALPWLFGRLAGGLAALIQHPYQVLSTAVLLWGVWGLWAYAQRAEVFRVAQVILPPESGFRVTHSLTGIPIWDVNVEGIARDLKKQQPWLKDVQVIRELPNAIRIVAVTRVPAGQVRLDGADWTGSDGAGRWHPVDQDGFVLPDQTDTPMEGLIRLIGFGSSGGGSLGVETARASPKVALALRVAEKLHRLPKALARRIIEVNVADDQEIRFLLDDGTEVRCGAEADLDTHLQRMRAALKIIQRQAQPVAYVDVRFSEPVFAPRM